MISENFDFVLMKNYIVTGNILLTLLSYFIGTFFYFLYKYSNKMYWKKKKIFTGYWLFDYFIKRNVFLLLIFSHKIF